MTLRLMPLTLLASLISVAPVIAQEGATVSHHVHPASSAKLVQDVQDATRGFHDVNNAGPAGYGPAFGCVSGPDHGAMGIHYVNGGFLTDGLVDVKHPEALIYEPDGDKLRLVGVEYIVDATTWLSTHDGPPALDNQVFQFVPAPNRYNLPSFFELHVWAWRENPNGAFVDWNNRVSCEGQ